MPIKRGPDGIPQEILSTSKKTQPNKPGSLDVNIEVDTESPTVTVNTDKSTIGVDNKKPSLFIEDEPPTTPRRQIDNSSDEVIVESSVKPVDEPKTSINRPNRPAVKTDKPLPGAESEPNTDSKDDAMLDPISGWLVVISGPGQGNQVKLGYGQNTIGRSQNERVCLDYGDNEISRNNHITITYDPRGKQFYIQPGSGTNLAYLNDGPTPVLQPSILLPNSHITIGNTTLRFIPFCSTEFNWEEIDE